MTNWFPSPPMIFDLTLDRARRVRSDRLSHDPEYIRVANRMEAERRAALPVIIGAKTKAKKKRREKSKAARKARRRK